MSQKSDRSALSWISGKSLTGSRSISQVFARELQKDVVGIIWTFLSQFGLSCKNFLLFGSHSAFNFLLHLLKKRFFCHVHFCFKIYNWNYYWRFIFRKLKWLWMLYRWFNLCLSYGNCQRWLNGSRCRCRFTASIGRILLFGSFSHISKRPFQGRFSFRSTNLEALFFAFFAFLALSVRTLLENL